MTIDRDDVSTIDLTAPPSPPLAPATDTVSNEAFDLDQILPDRTYANTGAEDEDWAGVRLSRLTRSARSSSRRRRLPLVQRDRVRPARIAQMLRRAILSGKHPPGTRLVERQVAAEFRVSRGPIREAFRLLEAERLVEIEAFKGASVVRLGVDEITELFELRGALFGLAARLAATRATKQSIAQIRSEVDKLEQAASSRAAPTDMLAQGARVSAAIVKASEAPELQSLIRQVVRKSQLHYAQIGQANLAAGLETIRSWRDIAIAMGRRDPDASERAVRRVFHQLQSYSLAALQK